jgi:DNA-binding PadR family transcriptional regulator
MPADYNQAYKNIQALHAFFLAQPLHARNEATTRLHLIDQLIFDCLGWDKEDCITEESQNREYTDYSLYAPHRLLIVEAKREGLYFELPAGMTDHTYTIRFFKKTHKEIYAAIEQGVNYCLKRGTPFGFVCNGHQLIAFLGSRTDGVSPLDEEAEVLVFDSLQSMEERFFELWQNISKPGIQAHRLSSALQKHKISPPPEKLSAKILGYPGYKNRNDIQNDLQILGELIIEDLIQSFNKVEFLKECYCESGAMSQYATINKRILETRYSALFQQTAEAPSLQPLVTRDGVNPQALAQSISRRPILLLGDVGVGKSIFIQHLINVTAADLIANSMVFYVDFGVNPTLASELRPYLLGELNRQLLEGHGIDIEENGFVRGVYRGDLYRFQRSAYSYLLETNPNEYKRHESEMLLNKIQDHDSHLKISFNHLAKARQKQIIIILDNIDQRPYEFQQQVFLIGQSMAETWTATVYLTIRPETFYKSKTSGTLSAYHVKAFTISPPRIDRVIQKRLEYAIKLLDKGEIPGLQGIGANLTTISQYLIALSRSFTVNDELIEFIDNVSSGNVRLALDLIKIFIGSGHVDTRKITQRHRYVIPLHEFMRAVIHGDQEYFDSSKSEFINVYDISSADGKEHFLCLLLLAQVDRWGQAANTNGYTARATLIEFAQNHGFQLNQISYALQRLVDKKLIETNTKTLGEDADSPLYYRITSMGALYYKKLVGLFAYVDPMVADTPILDTEVRSKISDVHFIDDRLERAKVFYSYLAEQWKLVASADLAFNFVDVYNMLIANVSEAQRAIKGAV